MIPRHHLANEFRVSSAQCTRDALRLGFRHTRKGRHDANHTLYTRSSPGITHGHHLEYAQRPYKRALPARVADSSSLAASNFASCPNRNPPSISSNQPIRKGSVRSPVRVVVGISFIWDYSSPSWAGKFLDEWCRQAMRSRIEPMKKIARYLRQHRELILNYFRARKMISSGVVEGLNNKAKVPLRKSYGFRYLPGAPTLLISLAWQAPRTGVNPRFLLTSQIYCR